MLILYAAQEPVEMLAINAPQAVLNNMFTSIESPKERNSLRYWSAYILGGQRVSENALSLLVNAIRGVPFDYRADTIHNASLVCEHKQWSMTSLMELLKVLSLKKSRDKVKQSQIAF